MRIEWIGAHQQLIGQLAQWHHAQWHALYDGWTLQAAADELSLHAGSQGAPTTLLLLDDTAGLLGSVSLLQEDSPELRGHEGPWLGNLLVTPSARGRGAGRALVAAAVAHAARLQLPRLRLFTPEHAGFYQAMGWQIEAQAVLQATPVTIMTIAPLPDPARRAQ